MLPLPGSTLFLRMWIMGQKDGARGRGRDSAAGKGRFMAKILSARSGNRLMSSGALGEYLCTAETRQKRGFLLCLCPGERCEMLAVCLLC